MRCDICELDLPGSDAQFQEHLNGKRHKRKLEASRKKAGVFITGLPEGKTKEHILQYFSQYGSIKKTRVGPTLKYVIIQYEYRHEAEKVINMVHNIDGKTLIVKWQNICAPRNNVLPSQELFNFINFHFLAVKEDQYEVEMMQRILNIPFLDMQIRIFIQYVTPCLDYMAWHYHKVKCDMLEAMSLVFPVCVVYSFGSTTTGLQFKNSDIDIFVEIEDDENCLTKARKGLYKSNRFGNVLVLSSAKVPIVRSIHSETGIKCDLNFKSINGVKNSELIRFYTTLDENVRPFILVIKYWAKVHEISGSNHLFTNYSLVMMCIFYLQHKHAFPSVKRLQRGTIPSHPKTFWNMNISQEAMRKFELYASLHSLLHGFFTFYSDFNYERDIICPYLGKPVERSLFLSDNTVPEEFRIYKMKKLSDTEPLKCDTPICLQDPIEHNVNTCKIIFSNILLKFVAMCNIAQSVLAHEGETDMLHNLFTKIEKIDSIAYQICIKRIDRPGSMNSGENRDHLAELWFERVTSFLITMFENILKLNMVEEVNPKAPKMPNQEDVHGQKQTVKYRATCSIDAWSTREVHSNRIKDNLEHCNTILERETLVTDSILTSRDKAANSSKLFDCMICVSVHKRPIRVNINFERLDKKGDFGKEKFHSFFTFVNSSLGPWFEKYEKELDESI